MRQNVLKCLHCGGITWQSQKNCYHCGDPNLIEVQINSKYAMPVCCLCLACDQSTWIMDYILERKNGWELPRMTERMIELFEASMATGFARRQDEVLAERYIYLRQEYEKIKPKSKNIWVCKCLGSDSQIIKDYKNCVFCKEYAPTE